MRSGHLVRDHHHLPDSNPTRTPVAESAPLTTRGLLFSRSDLSGDDCYYHARFNGLTLLAYLNYTPRLQARIGHQIPYSRTRFMARVALRSLSNHAAHPKSAAVGHPATQGIA